MNTPAPGISPKGTDDTSLDIDGFQFSEADAEAAAAKAEAFIEGQPEIEAVNTCESGACSI